ncbi:toluene tolerance protein Ttg2D domain protein, partial [Bordetella bronchiseptica E012]
MRFSIVSLLHRLFLAGALALAAGAQAAPDPMGPPDKFVLDAATQTIDILKSDQNVKAGNLAHINQVVDAHILPFVNFQKTTRLAAGRYWR